MVIKRMLLIESDYCELGLYRQGNSDDIGCAHLIQINSEIMFFGSRVVEL